MNRVDEGDEPLVRRRRVFYLPGYDPRRPSVYRDLFARELGKAAALRSYEAKAGALDETDPEAPSFTIDSVIAGVRVEAYVSILRWDDLARPVYRQKLIPRLPKLLRVGAGLLWRGVFLRVARLDWQFAAFLIYPYAMTLLAIASVAGIAIVAGGLAAAFFSVGLPPAFLSLAVLSSALAGAAVTGWIWVRVERSLYLRYLLEDWLFSFAHERGANDLLAERLDAFAAKIAKAAADPEIDEVLLVGHSSGAFLAPEALALALDRHIDPTAAATKISLLTIGAMASLMLLIDRDSPYGAALARLADEPRISWFEVQSRHDVMNMCPVDPVAVSRLFDDRPIPPRWPHILRLSMPQLVEPGQLGLFRERLRFFRNHFRFIAANDRLEWYDFYGMISGTQTLEARLGRIPPSFRKPGGSG
ncbi:MAG TPA: hypothetical protein VLQ65_09365 [Saliniramus sp.]|nr:hypothetical protein [Saliniramus sp.]